MPQTGIDTCTGTHKYPWRGTDTQARALTDTYTARQTRQTDAQRVMYVPCPVLAGLQKLCKLLWLVLEL